MKEQHHAETSLPLSERSFSEKTWPAGRSDRRRVGLPDWTPADAEPVSATPATGPCTKRSACPAQVARTTARIRRVDRRGISGAEAENPTTILKTSVPLKTDRYLCPLLSRFFAHG